MFTSRLHIPWNSIRLKLVIGVLAIMLPLISLLIYNNSYATKVVHTQVSESYYNMMSLYMGQIDNNLHNVDKYLTNLQAYNKDIQIMEFATEESEYFLSKMRLYNKISEDISMYSFVSSVYIYSIPKGDYIAINSANDVTVQSQAVSNYIISTCKELSSSGKMFVPDWYVNKVGNDYYLFRILKVGDIYFGAWIDAKRLMVSLSMTEIGENATSLLVTDKGVPMMNEQLVNNYKIDLTGDFKKYYSSGNKQKYLVVGEKSTEGNFSLMALIPEKNILEKLPFLQKINTLISFGILMLFPVVLFLLRKVLLVPLKRMLSAMRRIQDGNLEVRIEPYKTSDEFQIVNRTFNKMIDEIQKLKIDVYEEKIHRQESELQHLQLQIQPHFFLNTLNIIHTLARGKKFELIQEMTLNLIQYFRYMFRSNLTFVSLSDELRHIKNYIRIQELRFPQSLRYEIDVQEFLLDTPVPPLVIHTFIENSIKYAVTLDEPVQLLVKGDFTENHEKEPYVKLVIKDSGKGFTPEVLSELQKGNRIIDEQGEHIGIWNVQRRLLLLYNGQASINLGNAEPNGAIIEILLPLNKEHLKKEGY